MPGKQAKILSTDHIDDLLFFADKSRSPLRNRLIVLLSTKAGLRAGEIAKLTWDMVLGASGEIGGVLELRDHAAKMGHGATNPAASRTATRVFSFEAIVAWRGTGCLL